MNMKLYVQVEIKDKNGNAVKRFRKQLCRSYVRQLIDLLRANMNAANTITMKNTTGNSNPDSFPNSMTANSSAGNAAYGVQVGTNTNAPTISDYAIGTLIPNGSASGDLNYGATSIGGVVIVGSTAQFTIARTFTNNSGADITVQEIALVIWLGVYSVWYLIEHSLNSFTIPNGQSGTVTYTLSVSI